MEMSDVHRRQFQSNAGHRNAGQRNLGFVEDDPETTNRAVLDEPDLTKAARKVRASPHIRGSNIILEKTVTEQVEEHLEAGDTEAATRTLRKNAKDLDINKKDFYGRTLLTNAVRKQNLEFVEAMIQLEREAAFEEHLMLDDSITQAVKEMNFDLVKMLLEFAHDRPGLEAEDEASGKMSYICVSTKSNILRKDKEERQVSCRDHTHVSGDKCKYCGESMISSSARNLEQIHGMRRITFSRDSSDFPDIVIENPLIQAAIMDTMNIDSMETFKTQHDIIYLFLQWGFDVPWPDVKNVEMKTGLRDLRVSKERLQKFRALCSPSLSSLTVSDTILHFFNLSKEVESLAEYESEFNTDYKELSKKCHQYTTSLLDQCRDSNEVEQILSQTSFEEEEANKTVGSFHYPRLLLAIQNLQKEFVVHPHCLKILDSTWSKDEQLWVSGYKHTLKRIMTFFLQLILLPFTCIMQIFWPRADLTQNTESCWHRLDISSSFWDHNNPKTKCVRHCASYLFFLGLLGAEIYKEERRNMVRYGKAPDPTETFIIIYVIGFLWETASHLCHQGSKVFFNDLWNIYFLITLLFFSLSYTSWAIGTLAFVSRKDEVKFEFRWQYENFNHVLFVESFYCIGTMMALLRMLQIFQLHRVWGPMQLTLLRTGKDMLYFVIIFLLFVGCCACGVQMLYVNYKEEWQIEQDDVSGRIVCEKQPDNFNGFRKTFKTLFFHLFGYGEQDDANLVVRNANLTADQKERVCDPSLSATNLTETIRLIGEELSKTLNSSSVDQSSLNQNLNESNWFLKPRTHQPTQLMGYIIVGVHDVVAVIILLNILIAMMNNTYSDIQLNADIEWKFNKVMFMLRFYHEHGITVPPPFNLIPSLGFFVGVASALKNRKWISSCCASARQRIYSVSRSSGYQVLQQKLHQRYMNMRAEEKARDAKKVTPELMMTLFEGLLRDKRDDRRSPTLKSEIRFCPGELLLSSPTEEKTKSVSKESTTSNWVTRRTPSEDLV